MKEKEEVTQLDLGIRESRKNKYYKIKGNIDRKMTQIEARKVYTDPWNWAFVTISIILILQQIRLILLSYEELPTYIQVFRYNMKAESQLVDKNMISIYPAISMASLLITFVISSIYYGKQRTYVKILILCSLLCIIAQSVILIDTINS